MSNLAFRIEVAYATPTQQHLLTLDVVPPCSVENAIKQSGILRLCPEIDLAHNRVGIYGRTCPLATILREHDRIEIYRALKVDPKEVRRRRADTKRIRRK
jgi:putative ubiquitin-RnfH superfamily antitoxin RatB of RatAB toxin-antitoxin module